MQQQRQNKEIVLLSGAKEKMKSKNGDCFYSDFVDTPGNI